VNSSSSTFHARNGQAAPVTERRSNADRCQGRPDVGYDPVMSRTLIVFDTECATARGAPHLLEIGAVRIADGDVVGHFEALVRPDVPIEPEAFEVHGIDDDLVRNARSAPDVIADFLRFAGDDWLVAHSVAQDAVVLGFEAARHQLDLPDSLMLDTLKLARHCAPEASDHKLDTLVQHFEIESDVHHRALADAVSCWKVLEACLEVLNEREDAESGREAGFLELLARAGTRTTLAGSKPRIPRLPQRLRRLERACREREAVTLLYGEDDAPSRLLVRPRILYAMGERSYLEGECQRSGTIKTYRLDRVQRVIEA
jgi:DNA polymerase III epsilon subunit family exonuclease